MNTPKGSARTCQHSSPSVLTLRIQHAHTGAKFSSRTYVSARQTPPVRNSRALEPLVIGIALLLLQQPAPAPQSHWQQEVDYQITARLDEPSGVLSGTQRIHYYNHSPDTLTTFSLHLFLNAFRPGSRWAAADSAEGRRRFNDLRDPD